MEYHEWWRAGTELVVDQDFAFDLRDVRKVAVIPLAVSLADHRARHGHPEMAFRVVPPIFTVKVRLQEADYDALLPSQEAAQRIADAISRSAALCYGNPLPTKETTIVPDN